MVENIPAYLAYWARQAPGDEALYVLGPVPCSYTYAALADMVASQAARLAGLGVGPGDRLAVLVNLDERLVVTLLAASSLGAVAVPVCADSPPCRDVLRCLARHRPFRAVALSGRFRALWREAGCGSATAELGLDVPSYGPVSEGRRSWWLAQVARRPTSAVFYVNHTSGSTTSPKMVEATDAQLLANARSCLDTLGGGRGLRLLCSFVYHQHEHFLRPLVVGGCAVLSPLHQGESDTAADCEAGRVTHLMTNPPRAEALAAVPAWKLGRLRGQLKVIEIGGGLVRAEAAARLTAGTGAAVRVAYGSTETAGVALVSPPGGGELRPLPGYFATVLAEPGTVAAVGRAGELVLEGAAVASGYLVPPPGEVRLEGGRFFTRDLAVRGQDGGIQVLGRTDNAIKLLGSRQPLEPIEEALRAGFGRHARLVQCLEVVADDYLGRRVGTAILAAVVLVDGACRSEHWCRALARRALGRARLAALLTAPRYFLFARPGEVLHTGGKLQRRHARERFPAELAAWRPEDRERLVPAPLLPGDLLRLLTRLRQESAALRHPLATAGRELARWVWHLSRSP